MFKDTEEDLSVYKECFLDLLGDDTAKIIKIINKNFTKIIFNYFNNHGKESVSSPKSEGDQKKESDNLFVHSDSLKKNPMISVKKRATILINQIKDENSDECKVNQRPNIFITDENSMELLYTDLLDSVMIFVQNVTD